MDEQVTRQTIEEKKQNYEEYVKGMTPTHNLFAQMGKAFLTGGIIFSFWEGGSDFLPAVLSV